MQFPVLEVSIRNWR